jgi:DNA-binding GntR family transcriptional regulator
MTKSEVVQAPRQAGNRVDWLVEILGAEIVSGALNAGDKISEPRLSKRFGVSRAPLREAIRRLEERRLLVRRPNLGVRVADFSAQDFIDLLHVREGLEGIAARLTATRADEAVIAQLRTLCADYAAGLGDEAGRLQTDLDFHYCIAQASGSTMLTSMLCDDFYAFFKIWRRRYPRLPGRSEVVLRQHLMIVEAIASRDPDLSEVLMRHHVKTSRESFLAVLRKQEETGKQPGRSEGGGSRAGSKGA